MDITIGSLIVAMKIKGLGGNYSITIIMGVLALLSFVLLMWYLKPGRKNYLFNNF
jgi:hypothetical protein